MPWSMFEELLSFATTVVAKSFLRIILINLLWNLKSIENNIILSEFYEIISTQLINQKKINAMYLMLA